MAVSRRFNDAPDSEWMEDALCATEPGRSVALSLEVSFTGRPTRAASRAAKELCAPCPVKDECLIFSKKIGATAGVWAGRITG